AVLVVITRTERPLIAPALIAPCAVLVGGMGAQADTTSPAPMLVTALVLLALARVGTLVPSGPLVWTAASTAVLAWAASLMGGFSWVGPDFTAAHLWGHGEIWPLLAAVVLGATSGLVSGLPELTRPACSV